ncbi:MAG TPA: hypothetical protein VH479_24305 [Acidimicrobiales bacterium]
MIVCRECGRRNENGTIFCENRDCGAFLEWSGEDLATEAVPVVKEAHGPGWGATGPRRSGVSEVGLTVNLPERELAVEPGAGVSCQVTVRNTGLIVDQYIVQVLGQPSQWATVDPPTLNLVPEAEATATVTFAPPRRPDVLAGVTPFRLVATSRQNPQAATFADGTVTVGAYHELTTQLRSARAEGRQGTYEVALENRGNAPVVAQVAAVDDRRVLAFQVSQPSVSLPPGGRAGVAVTARPARAPASGQPTAYPFRIVAQAGWDPPRSMDAELLHRPPLPPAPHFGREWLPVARIGLTLVGALLMILGANRAWLNGVKGTDLTYASYVDTVFQADVAAPPARVDRIFVSLGLVVIVLAVFALLGLAGRTGLLTRLAAGLALLLLLAYALTVGTSNASLGSGTYVAIFGAVLALAGGVVGIANKA